MLCLNSQDIQYQNQELLINSNLAAKLEKSLKKGSYIAVFHKNEVIKYFIEAGYNNQFKQSNVQKEKSKNINNTISIKVTETQRKPVQPVVSQTLFLQEHNHNVPDSVFDAWLSLSDNLEKPKPFLNIKARQDSYIRFIYSHIPEKIFIESYMQWPDWIKLQNEFLMLRNEIDICIKNQARIEDKISVLQELIDKLFKKINIPLTKKDLKNNECSLIDIYWNGKGVFIPFEALDKILVRYLIPADHKRHSAEAGNMTIIYSKKIKNSASEINELKKLMDKRFNVETYSDNNYQDYKYNLRNSHLLHFCGHGEIQDQKGMLNINNALTDQIPNTDNLHLAFLNCCLTGLYSEGVISNLIENGSEYVIASPYEISDQIGGNTRGIMDFYSICNPEEISASFFLNAIKNPDFRLFYRLYGRYCDKI